MEFRRKSPIELQKFSDDELIEYVVAARDENDSGAIREALAILVYGRLPFLTAFIAKRLKGNSQDAEDVAAKVMENVITSSFDGESVGQFINWMKQIAVRRAWEFNKKATDSKGDVTYQPEDPENWTELPSDAGETGVVEVTIIVEEVLANRSKVHQDVVIMKIDGFKSKEVVDLVNGSDDNGGPVMTNANVDQIYKRFRDDLHDELRGGG
ncbi:MAG: hypothetical protein JJE13_06920 [Thermoleophilia bacterium]|nr:hypothetical protein [Thermoleophilia bacterium]